MTSEELKELIHTGEADRVELTRAAQDTEKFRQAICSFSNDMAGRGLPGYLLIGIDENNPAHRLPVTTEMLDRLVGLRSDGAILPLPMMNVSRALHPDGGGEIIVVEVHPNPEVAMSDGQQSLKPQKFSMLMEAIRPLLKVMNKTL